MSRLPSDSSNPKAAPGIVEETRLESFEEIHQGLGGGPPAEPPADLQPFRPGVTAQDSRAAGLLETQPFRPFRRPPVALLCILDDGLDDGEWVRLRRDRMVIGRGECDVRIPHDTMMSGRHAELVRQELEGSCQWVLNDLNSTNGTFVRIAGAVLQHGQELLIGSKRFRFEEVPPGQPAEASRGRPNSTCAWQAESATDLAPSLVEVLRKGNGQVIPLVHDVNWLGRDPDACTAVLANDPTTSPRHFRIYRDDSGRWRVENAGSRNGTWLRVSQQPLAGACQFQLGEQRFLWRALK